MHFDKVFELVFIYPSLFNVSSTQPTDSIFQNDADAVLGSVPLVPVIKKTVYDGRQQTGADNRYNNLCVHFAPEGNAPTEAGAVVCYNGNVLINIAENLSAVGPIAEGATTSTFPFDEIMPLTTVPVAAELPAKPVKYTVAPYGLNP